MKRFLTVNFLVAFLGTSAANLHARIIVPVPVQAGLPMISIPVVGIPTLSAPSVNSTLGNLDFPLPVPSIPGIPMYRLPNIRTPERIGPIQTTAMSAPVYVAAHGLAPNTAHPGGLQRAAAVSPTFRSVRRFFGMDKDGKKDPLSAEKLRRAFDGSQEVKEDRFPIVFDNPSRPQTLPEEDLLREMGL